MPEPVPATILTVDDTDAHRYAVARLLKRAGYRVEEAATGEEALRQASRGVDLIVLDIKLPDIDGYEVCRRLKQDPATASVPVLHLSASFTHTADKIAGLDSGADGYLAAPVEGEELLATIESLLRGKRAEHALREKQERLELAQQAAQLGFWDWDIVQDHVTWSDQVYSIFDRNHEHRLLHYNDCLAAVHPEDRQRVDQTVRSASLQAAPHELEYRVVRPDGRVRWVESRGVTICDDGRPVRMLGVVLDVTDRKRAEEIRREEEVRRQLLDRVISAQEEERRRLARELHDEAGQLLTSLLVGLRTIEDARTLARAKKDAHDLREIATRAIDQVRRLARGLHPAVLDDLGLGVALARYCAEYQQAHGIEVELDLGTLDESALPAAVQMGLYRIAQEALTNVAKHARAQSVSILFEALPDSLQLAITDDGCGLDSDGQASTPGHLGLQGMSERAAMLGGSINIVSEKGKGTTVLVSVPLPQQR